MQELFKIEKKDDDVKFIKNRYKETCQGRERSQFDWARLYVYLPRPSPFSFILFGFRLLFLPLHGCSRSVCHPSRTQNGSIVDDVSRYLNLRAGSYVEALECVTKQFKGAGGTGVILEPVVKEALQEAIKKAQQKQDNVLVVTSPLGHEQKRLIRQAVKDTQSKHAAATRRSNAVDHE